jgi:hypothetical protein
MKKKQRNQSSKKFKNLKKKLQVKIKNSKIFLFKLFLKNNSKRK